MPRFIFSVIVPALAARDRHRLRRPAISSIIEPCRPSLSWVGKGSSVFSERESLLKCTEHFGPNLVAATRVDSKDLTQCNAGDDQFLWPRRPPIIGKYRTLQTMVIVGRIAPPLGAWTEGCRCRWYDIRAPLIPFLCGSDCTDFGAWTQCR